MKKYIHSAAVWGLVLLLCSGLAFAGGIQTQFAMRGDVEVDVMKAKVSGDILTIVLAYKNNGGYIKLEENAGDVHYIEKDSKKKYHLLKDETGRYLGDPISGSKLYVEIRKTGQRQMAWFKFPAPPEGVSKIDLSIPGVIPFDELPISR